MAKIVEELQVKLLCYRLISEQHDRSPKDQPDILYQTLNSEQILNIHLIT